MNTFLWVLFVVIYIAWSYVSYLLVKMVYDSVKYYYNSIVSFYKDDEFILMEMLKIKPDDPKAWIIYGNNTKYIYAASKDEVYCNKLHTKLYEIKLKQLSRK